MPLVLDASTAILLAKVGLLRKVVGRIRACMGKTAVAEAQRKQTDDAVAIATLVEEGILLPLEGGEVVQGLIHDFRLHAGEAEAVALAKDCHAACATDDGRAIRCCKALGVPFTTAVGLLVAMAEARELDGARAAEVLLQMERFGRYHPRILEDAAARIRAAGRVGERR